MSAVETSICISVLCVYILKATSPTRIVNRLGKRNWVRLNWTPCVRRGFVCINTRDIVKYDETVSERSSVSYSLIQRVLNVY